MPCTLCYRIKNIHDFYTHNATNTTTEETPAEISLLSGSDLCFGCTSHLLHSVLLLFSLFERRSVLLEQTETSQTILGFVLLQIVQRIVDQSESCSFATTKSCTETEAHDAVGRCFVHTSKLLAYVTLGHCSFTGMQNVNDHLSSHQQSVRHELTCSYSRCVAHDGLLFVVCLNISDYMKFDI